MERKSNFTIPTAGMSIYAFAGAGGIADAVVVAVEQVRRHEIRHQ
jgi:hypothetical protein